MPDDGITSFEDAASIGFKIVEMAERVAKMEPIMPGSQAAWAFEIDDVRYEVFVRKGKPK